MSRRWLSVIVAAGVGGICVAADYSHVRSPVGPGTIPPTTYESGLVPSINPVDLSGNAVVTGNVGGGRHFRGVVPYRGATDFTATDSSRYSTSWTYDDFLRRSAGWQDSGQQYRGGSQPFYSPTRTVTGTAPGLSGVYTPQSPPLAPGTTSAALQSARTPGSTELSGYDRFVSKSQGWMSRPLDGRPLSITPRELEKIMAGHSLKDAQDNRAAVELPRHLLNVPAVETTGPPGTGVSLPSAEQVTQAPAGAEVFDWFTGKKQAKARGGGDASAETPTPLGQAKRTGKPAPGFTSAPDGAQVVDIYEQMLQQTGDVSAAAQHAGSAGPITGTVGPGQTAPATDAGSGLALSSRPRERQQRESDEIAAAGQDVQPRTTVSTTPEVRVRYDSFATISEDRFNEHIRAAEALMKEGRYYRAADAYTLATIYKRSDPLGYAGKCHALFAAGEYMSSALYLARTLEIFPEYAGFKIDIVAMIGDKDRVETRLAEARQLATSGGSPELMFLLSYVYYQLGRLEFARVAIEAAAQRMPDSYAVAALKKAIDEAVAGQ